MSKRALCWDCQHKKENPGSCHVRCGARVTDDFLKKNPMYKLGMIMCSDSFGWGSFNPQFPDVISKCELYEANP